MLRSPSHLEPAHAGVHNTGARLSPAVCFRMVSAEGPAVKGPRDPPQGWLLHGVCRRHRTVLLASGPRDGRVAGVAGDAESRGGGDRSRWEWPPAHPGAGGGQWGPCGRSGSPPRPVATPGVGGWGERAAGGGWAQGWLGDDGARGSRTAQLAAGFVHAHARFLVLSGRGYWALAVLSLSVAVHTSSPPFGARVERSCLSPPPPRPAAHAGAFVWNPCFHTADVQVHPRLQKLQSLPESGERGGNTAGRK